MENITSIGQIDEGPEHKELLVNFEFAKFQITQEHEHDKMMLNNRWRVIAFIGSAMLFLLLILLGIISWCLYIGKEQFVLDFLKYSLYPISAGGGFWAGRISIHHQKQSNLNPTQL